MTNEQEYVINTALTANMVAKMVSDVSDNFNSAYSGHDEAKKTVSDSLQKMSLMGQFFSKRPDLAGDEINVVMGEVIKTYNEPNLSPLDKGEILAQIKKSINQYANKCLSIVSKIDLNQNISQKNQMSI